MSKPKILFVYDMKLNTPWKDGLWAALNLLEKDFEIKRWNYAKGIEDYNEPLPGTFDFILGWGDFCSAIDYWMHNENIKNLPKGLCIAGTTNTKSQTMFDYNVLFYETQWQKDNFLNRHLNTVHAFGTNTDIFFPCEEPDKLWDYIGVGSLSSWKRWNFMTQKPGRKLVVGHYQEENREESDAILHDLILGGVMVSNQIEPERLAELYSASKVCYIPSISVTGGERAFLEARTCGIGVECEDDNPKLKSLLEGPIYDQNYYYQQLKKGIDSVL